MCEAIQGECPMQPGNCPFGREVESDLIESEELEDE